MRETKHSEFGPMIAVPIAEQRKIFDSWVRSGRRPDMHPNVLPASFPPPNSEEIEIVGEVSLRNEYQDSVSYFHCNVCGVERKFKNDGFCSTYGDGHWYLVGPDCGSEHHRRALSIGVLHFSAALAETDAERRIGKFYAHFDRWAAIATDAQEIAKEQLEARKQLDLLKPLMDELGSARKVGGKLEIELFATAEDDYGDYGRVEIAEYGGLKGTSFLLRPFPTTGLAKIARQKLETISNRQFDKSAFEAVFEEALTQKSLKRFEAQVRDAEDAIKELVGSALEVGKFLSKENLKHIENWNHERRRRRKEIDRQLPFSGLPPVPKMKMTTKPSGYLISFGSIEPIELKLEKSALFKPKLPY